MKRVALYIRVSSDQQAKFGDSLRDQQETLEEYVSSQNDLVIHDTYIDDGISGQKLDRDEFTRLLNDVEIGRIDLILFTKLDRWFRSLKHYLNVQEILEKHGVHWTAVTQAYYDTSTAYGRTFINQVMSFAELEAQMTSERNRSVNANKVKNGEVITGTTPFGYSIENKHLVPNDDAPIALAIFEKYDQTCSYSEVLSFMKETFGIKRTRQGLRKMLQNRLYLGEYRENINYCVPIIPHDLFQRVQEKLSRNTKSNTTHDYIFQGLIYCGSCGRRMTSGQTVRYGKMRLDGTQKNYGKASMYRCRYHNSDTKDCANAKTIRETVLEDYLRDHVDEMMRFELVRIEKKEKQVIDVSEKKNAIESKLARLKALYLNEILDLDEYKRDREEMIKSLEALDLIQPATADTKKDLLQGLVGSNIFDHYYRLSNKEKREFWNSFISKIVIDANRNISVEFSGSTHVLTDTDRRASFRR